MAQHLLYVFWLKMADHEKQNVHPSIVKILGKGSHPPKDNLHV